MCAVVIGVVPAIILEVTGILIKPFLYSPVLTMEVCGIFLAPPFLRISLAFFLTFRSGAHFLPIFGSGIGFK